MEIMRKKTQFFQNMHEIKVIRDDYGSKEILFPKIVVCQIFKKTGLGPTIRNGKVLTFVVLYLYWAVTLLVTVFCIFVLLYFYATYISICIILPVLVFLSFSLHILSWGGKIREVWREGV